MSQATKRFMVRPVAALEARLSETGTVALGPIAGEPVAHAASRADAEALIPGLGACPLLPPPQPACQYTHSPRWEVVRETHAHVNRRAKGEPAREGR